MRLGWLRGDLTQRALKHFHRLTARDQMLVIDDHCRHRVDAGALVVPSTPEALAARMERETAAWAEVVRAAKITAG